MSADHWGISYGYHDLGGAWIEASHETRSRLARAMGVDLNDHPSTDNEPRVVRPGESVGVNGRLLLEEGGELQVDGVLPPDTPLGYHFFQPREDKPPARWICSPGECALPRNKTWGWAVQLYAARSRDSWGIGDLNDLRRLAKWSAGLNAGIMLINPLFASSPTTPQQPSPYFPSSRRFRNPIYLRVEDAPGADVHAEKLAPLTSEARALNAERRIDRDRVFSLKMEALAILWSTFPRDDPGFLAFLEREGTALQEYAAYCCLAEAHGPNWRVWPHEYQNVRSEAVARYLNDHADRGQFHCWLQWLLDRQLGAAGAEIGLMQDLPIGFEPDGVDAWVWQDVLADQVSVGAPPDYYATEGQDWGLPPFAPHKLRAAGYEPFIQTIRACLRHAGGLRIDHVMGLFRLFWIPWGEKPRAGGYVRYPGEDLMAILALESHRANAFIVGEDLGMVEDLVRESLARHRVLSYRLLWFEPRPPSEYPPQSLAAVTTHDLPTIAGMWTGADREALKRLGREPSPEADREMRDKLERMAGAREGDSVEVVIEKAYRALATAPSPVLTATLEDGLAVEERPNMPGTLNEWPNWSLALPKTIEEIEQEQLPRTIAQALTRS